MYVATYIHTYICMYVLCMYYVCSVLYRAIPTAFYLELPQKFHPVIMINSSSNKILKVWARERWGVASISTSSTSAGATWGEHTSAAPRAVGGVACNSRSTCSVVLLYGSFSATIRVDCGHFSPSHPTTIWADACRDGLRPASTTTSKGGGWGEGGREGWGTHASSTWHHFIHHTTSSHHSTTTKSSRKEGIAHERVIHHATKGIATSIAPRISTATTAMWSPSSSTSIHERIIKERGKCAIGEKCIEHFMSPT